MRFSPCIPPVPLIVGAVLLVGCNDQGPSNMAPTAAFTAACVGLSCQLNDSSSDADGTIQAYAWDFGDGAHSTEANPVHAYAAPGGQFTIRLWVTDNDGDSATAAKPVAVAPANGEPVANFTVACTHLTCRFTDESTDPDAGGLVVSRLWNFGDGQSSTEQHPVHTYGYPGGRFNVILTVTDDSGAVGTTLKQIDVALGPAPDRSGTYERETPHSTAGRHSRYVLRADSTFEVRDWTGADTTAFTGRWTSACCWMGWAIEPGSVFILDFDGFDDPSGFCGEGFATVFLDGHLGLAYCGPMISAGLEEGVYSSDPLPSTPGPAPPQAGQIAFVRDGAIHLANTDGGGVVQLTNGPSDFQPAWSPDGSRIAFTRSGGGTSGVFIMDADGGNLVERVPLGSDPTWSPDGEWIAFACPVSGQAAICKVRVDDQSMPVPVYQELGQAQQPAWSPDGTRIAFMSDRGFYDSWFDIWVVAPDGSQLATLNTHTPAFPNPFEHYQPAWSADGQRIAFVSCAWAWNLCSSSAVSVMSADGSGAVRLVAASGFASPTWSPDGQVIAFASSNAIEWVSVDGSQRGRIIDNGHSPAWRP